MNKFSVIPDHENTRRDLLHCLPANLVFRVFDDNRLEFILKRDTNREDAVFSVDTHLLGARIERTLHFVLLHDNPLESALNYALVRDAVDWYCKQKNIATEDIRIYGANTFTYGTYDVAEESDEVYL